MKKLNELIEQRTALIEKMETLVKLGTDENRSLTETENNTWSDDNTKIETLDTEIKMLKRQEELNKTKVKIEKKTVETPEGKTIKRFNLFKAFKESLSGNLSGVELEVTQEGQRSMTEAGKAPNPRAVIIPPSMIKVGIPEQRAAAYVATGDGAPPIKYDYADTLSVVRTPILIDTLGVKKYEGLIGSFGIPSMAQLAASFVAEEAAVDSAAVVLAKAELKPRRCGSSEIFK